MTHPLFTQLQAACELAGWRHWHEAATEDDPLEQMHVLVHVDAQSRNFVVRLLLAPAAGSPSEPPRTELLDMAVILPFKVQPQAVSDVARLLSAINLAGLIGAFALAEADSVVLLRYGWHVPPADLTAARVVPLLDMMSYHASETAPMIEQVAGGTLTFEQIADAVRTALGQSGQPA